MAGDRDRCLLLIGFAAALRRSELVGLDVGDIEDTEDGLIVTITRSKSDQDGEGRQVGDPYGGDPATCPIRSFRRWVAAIDASSKDPLFRPITRHGRIGQGRLSDRAVAIVVKGRPR